MPQQQYIPQHQLAPQYVPQSGFQVPAGYRPAQIGQPAPSAHMRPQNFTSNAQRIQQRSDHSVQRASHLAQQHNLKPVERSNGEGSTRKLPVNNDESQNNKKINQRRSSSQKKVTPRKGSRARRTRSNPLRPAKNRSVELPVPDSNETIEFPVEEAQGEPKANTISMSNPYR